MNINDAPEHNRYEAWQDDALAGWLDYRRQDTTIFYDHVEVIPAMRGKGIADQIVTKAIAAARAENLQIVALCPYVRDWLTTHASTGL